MKLRLAGMAFLAVVFGLVFLAPVRAEDAKKFTAREKLGIVVEGIAHPDQRKAICKKLGITEETYNQWVSQLESAAEKICGETQPAAPPPPAPAPAAGAAPSAVSTVAKETVDQEVTLGIGSETFRDVPSENWRFFGTYKNYFAFSTFTGGFTDGKSFSGFVPLMGAAVGAQKGKDSFSAQFLGPVEVAEDEHAYLYQGFLGVSEAESQRNWYFDVRYLRSINQNLSVGAGYRLGIDMLGWRHSLGPQERILDIGHGPDIVTALNFPLWEKALKGKLQFTGNVQFAPVAFLHSSETGYVNSSHNALYIYANPELGFRYEITPNASVGAGYRWDITASQTASELGILQGPTVSLSLHW